MLQKRMEYQLKSLPGDLGKLMFSRLGPGSKGFDILYQHWLRANQEMLKGFLAVIEYRLAEMAKEQKRDTAKGKEKVKVQ